MNDEQNHVGRQGDAGPAGREGVAGVPGQQGVTGREGDRGRTGEAGVAGVRGRTGAARPMRWAPALGFAILAVAGVLAAVQLYHLVSQNRELINQNRALIDRVTKDCVDRDGDLSYRHFLRGLIRMNNNKDPFTNRPMPATITLDERRTLTAELLKRGLDEAGSVPPCIEARAP